jgi:hypothetical protein
VAERPRSTNEPQSWHFSDAWFLESLGWTSRDERSGATLVGLISTADYINHAVLTREEIESAVNKLRSAGLLELTEDRFLITPAGAELRERADDPSVYKRMRRLEQLLTQVQIDSSSEPWHLSEAAYAEVVAAYLAKFSKGES